MPELLNNQSTGPKTPEGKKRSSQNSIRHGLTAKTLVLEKEDEAQYQDLLSDYLRDLAPGNRVETDLVHSIVAARWRIQRTWGLETRASEVVDALRANRDKHESPESGNTSRRAFAPHQTTPDCSRRILSRRSPLFSSAGLLKLVNGRANV